MNNILHEMDIIGTETLSCDTDLTQDDISSVIKNYNTNLQKLKEYGIPETVYEELKIIEYIKSKRTLYDSNNVITDIGTSYRLYIYKNPNNSGDVVYAEYDYGFGDFFLTELKSTSTTLTDVANDYVENQYSNIEMFRKILDSKISDIENSEEILKIRDKYFTNLIDNINKKLLLKKDSNGNTSSNTIIVNNIIKKEKKRSKKRCNNRSKKRSLQKKIDKCLKKLDKISN
jgi:hypothetical protein